LLPHLLIRHPAFVIARALRYSQKALNPRAVNMFGALAAEKR